MNRRSVLTTLGAGLGTVGGCTGSGRPPVGLGEIGIVNRLEAPVGLSVTVERAGDRVYDRTHRLDGREGNVVDGTEIVEDWMGDRVDYAVTVTARDRPLSAGYSTADAEAFVDDWGDHDCFRLDFLVEPDDIPVALGAMESCPTGQ